MRSICNWRNEGRRHAAPTIVGIGRALASDGQESAVRTPSIYCPIHERICHGIPAGSPKRRRRLRLRDYLWGEARTGRRNGQAKEFPEPISPRNVLTHRSSPSFQRVELSTMQMIQKGVIAKSFRPINGKESASEGHLSRLHPEAQKDTGRNDGFKANALKSPLQDQMAHFFRKLLYSEFASFGSLIAVHRKVCRRTRHRIVWQRHVCERVRGVDFRRSGFTSRERLTSPRGKP
jgi:hypothetical protein